MNRLCSKLTSQRGETLAEVLCTLLVVTLASVALATMLSVASRLNASAVERDTAFYADSAAAEERTSPAIPGEVALSGPGISATIPVSWYGAEGLWSYAGDFDSSEEGGGTP